METTTNAYDVRLEERTAGPAAVVRAHVDAPDIATFLTGVFAEVVTAAAQQGAGVAGPPFGRYVPDGRGFDVAAGFPVDRPITRSGRVEPDELPAGIVALTVHRGAYDDVGAAYGAVTEWLTAHGMTVAGEPWETYLDGPDVARPRTEVRVPCARRRTTGT